MGYIIIITVIKELMYDSMAMMGISVCVYDIGFTNSGERAWGGGCSAFIIPNSSPYRTSSRQPVSPNIYLVRGSNLSLLPSGVVTNANSYIRFCGGSAFCSDETRVQTFYQQRLMEECIFLPVMDVYMLATVTPLLIVVEMVLESLDWSSIILFSLNQVGPLWCPSNSQRYCLFPARLILV